MVLLAVATAVAPTSLLGDLCLVGAMLFVATFALNPAMTTSSVLVDELAVPPAEAFGWLSARVGPSAAHSPASRPSTLGRPVHCCFRPCSRSSARPSRCC
ncbi:hypothetical protein ACFLIM_48435 [Nonomuraea sp. M3C6]|uniref:Major facilitator superfamily (MFS) profile domain-containing protein n=1 Tax=Nonomuraea marmarensis TaxID=3351344 RepID=A0ABW7AVE3_9ACTN